MDLDGLPWAEVDGPSLVSCAAGLQLLGENIPCLLRIQRLAAIGASLPALPGAPFLAPSRLRALLKHEYVASEMARSQEDPYDDLYVEEVAFHGGPRLVLQGLTSHSAHTVQVLLSTIFGPYGEGLPAAYVQQAHRLTQAVLSLSDAICSAAGLRRGMAAAELRRGEPFVPGREKLAELRAIVTFTSAELAELLPEGSLQELDGWTVEAGAHPVALRESSDDGLVLTPLLRHGPDLIVANPGELAAGLRHRLIVLAMEHGCRDALAEAFRQTVGERVGDLLRGLGAVPLGPAAPAADPLVLRQCFGGAANTIIDVGVLTDDLSGYNPAEPFGRWDIPDLGGRLQDCLDPPGDPDEDDYHTLRLAVTDGVARDTFLGLEPFRRPGPLLMLTLDELQVMIDLDRSDPLFLWRFARADERFHETTQILEFAKLDTYAIYRRNDRSFYLDDDRPPTFANIATGSGTELRIRAQRRHDRHHVPGPDGRRYVEVMSVYGLDTAPIYFLHPRHGLRAAMVELEGATVWVVPQVEDAGPVRAFVHDVLEAVAYWIWQLGKHLPATLAGAAGRNGRLTVTVTPDGQWSHVLAGGDLALEGTRAGDSPDSAGPWATASGGSPGACALVLHSDRAEVLLSDTNVADRQLRAALVQALTPPAAAPAQLAGIVDNLAPAGLKRMVRVVGSSDVLMRPVRVPVRIVEPAVTAAVLDDLGQWLAGQGMADGPVPDDKRTDVLAEVVEYYFGRLTQAVAGLSPDGLMEFLVLQDKALLQDAAIRGQSLPSRLACFGAESVLAQDLLAEESKNIEASVASRFLVEYVAAVPPGGDRAIDLMIYDDLLALAAELISRGTLSDAIRYGFSQVRVSRLPSGRLGVSRGDRYSAGVRELAQVEAEARHAMAMGAGLAGNVAPAEAREPGETEKPTLARADAAMRAEFGFSLTDVARGLEELIAVSDEVGTEPYLAGVDQVRTRLRTSLGWDRATAQAFLDSLTLRPRAKLLSAGADCYPWKFNRDLSYMRRPLIELAGPDGEPVLMWGTRRAAFARRYWAELIFTARLKSKTKAMAQLMGTIRQHQNKAFEHQVATVLSQAGMPVTAASVKRIAGHRLVSGSGADLGDIDAIALDPARKILIVAEAKDFELARTPAELSNEATDLVTGDKSAAAKLARRTDWVRGNMALVLRHLEVSGSQAGWRILPVIVTSRNLISPRVIEASIPVVALTELPAWVAKNKRSPTRQRRR